ncbi:MAG: HAMP domain-containing sensor histidine kinase [bacterium]
MAEKDTQKQIKPASAGWESAGHSRAGQDESATKTTVPTQERSHTEISTDAFQVNLFQMEKMAAIGQLSSSVAHEMHNLLGMIRTATFNIDRALKNPDQTIQTNLEIITRSIRRAREFIDNLLNLSRIPTGTKEEVDITSVFDSLLTLFSKEMEWRGIQLVKRYQHVPSLRVDRNMLQECLLNIILNAIQSMENGGDLTVRTESWKHGVRITISDTGCGIHPTDLNRIFEQFFTTKRDGPGTGLGLTIARALAREMNGDVTVESEVDKGSTFCILLPNTGKEFRALDSVGVCPKETVLDGRPGGADRSDAGFDGFDLRPKHSSSVRTVANVAAAKAYRGSK